MGAFTKEVAVFMTLLTPKGYVLIVNILDPFFVMPREFYVGQGIF